MSDLSNIGPVTHDEAFGALRRFMNAFFRADGERPRISIPPQPRDDDIRLREYIGQQRAKDAEIERLRSENAALEAMFQHEMEETAVVCEALGINAHDDFPANMRIGEEVVRRIKALAARVAELETPTHRAAWEAKHGKDGAA